MTHDPELYLLKHLAKKGNIDAMYKMYRYYTDMYNNCETDESIQWLYKAAKAGHCEAMYEVGMRERSRCWDEEYAITGNDKWDRAQRVKYDLRRKENAIYWLLLAAEKNHQSAKDTLCMMYPSPVADLAVWMIKEAESGNPLAQYRLGLNYLRQDNREAKYWLSKSANQGNHAAQLEMGKMFLYGDCIEKDYVCAEQWLRKSADGGKAEAQYELGNMYLYGIGVPQDDSRAAILIASAAEANVHEAQKLLGNMYANGWGVPKDINKAQEWLDKATDDEIII